MIDKNSLRSAMIEMLTLQRYTRITRVTEVLSKVALVTSAPGYFLMFQSREMTIHYVHTA